jgi:cobalt-zinc-cadmium resistance protein CzcA
MTVRWLAPYRNDVTRLKEILITSPSGSSVPLGTLAEVKLEEGPALVYREANHRYVPVKFSVRGRDLAGTVAEAQQRVAELKLPYDVHLEWSGEINELKQATRRLTFIVPLTLLLITLLVYAAVRRWQDTLIVLFNIPIACCGGVLALLITRIDFSISAAMGFISVFGIAVQDGILVVSYTKRLLEQGHSLEEAVLLASQRRLRPVLMTTLVAMLGLTPAALSNAIGSQTQKPLAVVVIGGALMLAILPRVAIPSLLLLFHRRMDRRPPPESAAAIPAAA